MTTSSVTSELVKWNHKEKIKDLQSPLNPANWKNSHSWFSGAKWGNFLIARMFRCWSSYLAQCPNLIKTMYWQQHKIASAYPKIYSSKYSRDDAEISTQLRVYSARHNLNPLFVNRYYCLHCTQFCVYKMMILCCRNNWKKRNGKWIKNSIS